MKHKPLLPALTLLAAGWLMSACGGGADDLPGPPRPPRPPPPTSTPQILNVSGTDTASFGSQLDLREFAASRPTTAGEVTGLMATSQGVLVPRLGPGGVPVLADPQVVITASAMGVSVSVTRQSGNRKWSYVTFCVSSTAPAPCPNINFDTANRRVTFNGMQVQHSGADDSLATAPITLNGSLRWAAADE